VLKNIVDNPDARKLQKYPVPVLGGIAVFFGIIVSLVCSQVFFSSASLFSLLGIMVIMLYIGTMDDILSLSPGIRFIIEIIIVLLLIYGNDCSINNFHGLWGIWKIPSYIAVPLTVFACVGIVNAINMIDGVDGLMSMYGITTSILFGAVFYKSGEVDMAAMAMIAAGAMIPFFMHNVFGKKSKMFLGDGGALMIGIMMSVFVIYILRDESLCSQAVCSNFGLVPFTLAVLSIPVFDTIRVMTRRILHGTSPFLPDKKHLHHMFIGLGFSHFGTAFSIVLLNLVNVLAWWISFRLGASVNLQLLVVIFMGLWNTFCIYKIVYWNKKYDTKLYHILLKLGEITHVERTGVWGKLRVLLDRNIL
jgi:UDP-N-acetylmuramyl pentapeptide phosphotransferase/UDP-N-acetylglucosamine-1-phosphate transferase